MLRVLLAPLVCLFVFSGREREHQPFPMVHLQQLLLLKVPLLVNQPKKKGKKEKKMNIKKDVQKKLVAQFPWVEFVVDPIGRIHTVHCKDCSIVEGKEKFINPKSNGLQKHVRKRKPLVPCLRVLVGDYYINNDNQCQRNDRIHAN